MTPARKTARQTRRRTGKQPDFTEMKRHADKASALLKAMASPHRLLVLCNLADGERSVGELREHVPLSQSALSQHLAILRAEGLVRTRREALTIYYSLMPGPSLGVMSVLHGTFCGPESARRKRHASRSCR